MELKRNKKILFVLAVKNYFVGIPSHLTQCIFAYTNNDTSTSISFSLCFKKHEMVNILHDDCILCGTTCPSSFGFVSIYKWMYYIQIVDIWLQEANFRWILRQIISHPLSLSLLLTSSECRHIIMKWVLYPIHGTLFTAFVSGATHSLANSKQRNLPGNVNVSFRIPQTRCSVFPFKLDEKVSIESNS